MIRVLLVDDEPLALERLQVAMKSIPETEIVGTAADGIEACKKIALLKPDAAILDIQMPGLSGVELAQSISGQTKPDIIFLTAFNDFAIEAFEVEATDYLLKPVTFDRLRLAIERVRRRVLSAADRRSNSAAPASADALPIGASVNGYDQGIWVPSRAGAVRVPIATIDRMEAARDYILLYSETKSHILRAKMNELEQRLDPTVMIRVHRSHIVRISAVAGIERPGKGALRLLLNDGATLQVGPNYLERVVAALRL